MTESASPDAAETSGGKAGRGLLSRLRRTARNVVQPPQPAPVSAAAPPPSMSEPSNRLLQMSPFAFGFFACAGGLLAIGLAQGLLQISSIVVTIILSLFLALGMNPAVEFVTRRGLPRLVGVLMVSVAFLAIVAAIIWSLIPIVADQVDALIVNVPGYIQNLQSNPAFAELEARYGIISMATTAATQSLRPDVLFGGLVGAGRILFDTVFSTVITIVLTLYFLTSLPAIKQQAYRLSPASKRPRGRYLADQMFERIGSYLSGMFFVASLSGVCSFIFLNFVGMGEYALALACVVAALAFIPLIGNPVSMIIVTLIALTQGITTGIFCLIYFLIYQQIEAYGIIPRVFQRSVNVPGAVVVIAALVGGSLLGVIGAVLAIPSAAVLLLLYREVLLPRLDHS
ncbi:AI-2E family transporter [Parenemella sanctibonifatiensis]|uniref:AI-2E family transporter n=2 Tax=Parenemella sanctibonifatiensis TaxID=2016505 RepID=A0A255EB08_9ACTN|nr:AI-2E family transporter [Parenemella sanctibonifatiensis]